MCSRYEFHMDLLAFAKSLGLDISRWPSGVEESDANANDVPDDNDPAPALETAGGEKRPTDAVPIIVPQWSLVQRRWGFDVNGVRGPVINARSETLSEKPSFRPLLQRRCLFPATAWFEWRKDRAVRFKNRITLPDHQPFMIAGLENGSDAVLITCAPAPSIAHIHDRMPALIGPNHVHDWLNPDLAFDRVRHMLAPVPDHVLSWQEETSRKTATDTAQIDLF